MSCSCFRTYQLKLFRECFCSPNGFNLNGDYKVRGVSVSHYRPFTLEANMAAAAALQEMLIQSRDDIIRVFPAVPDEWRRNGVSFRRLRAEGGILVSAAAADCRTRSVTLETERDGIWKLENSFRSENLHVDIDGNVSSVTCREGALFAVDVLAGQNGTITAAKER